MSLFRSHKKVNPFTQIDKSTYLITRIQHVVVGQNARIPKDWQIISATLTKYGGIKIIYTKEFRIKKLLTNGSS